MFEKVKTPCYIVDEKKIRENLEILKKVQEESGCRILLAQKAFSMFRLYPMIGEYLRGTTASGLFEARLGKEEMGKENLSGKGNTGGKDDPAEKENLQKQEDVL